MQAADVMTMEVVTIAQDISSSWARRICAEGPNLGFRYRQALDAIRKTVFMSSPPISETKFTSGCSFSTAAATATCVYRKPHPGFFASELDAVFPFNSRK